MRTIARVAIVAIVIMALVYIFFTVPKGHDEIKKDILSRNPNLTLVSELELDDVSIFFMCGKSDLLVLVENKWGRRWNYSNGLISCTR